MRSIVCVCLLLLLGSCGEEKLPDGVLASPKMEALIADLMRADEVAEYYGQKDSVLQLPQRYAAEYEKVFALHGITGEQFQKSLRYYRSRPDLLKPVFDTLQSRMEQKLKTAAPPAPPAQ